MSKYIFIISLFISVSAICATSPPPDTVVALPEIEVSEVREATNLPSLRQAQQIISLSSSNLSNAHCVTPKDIAMAVPNMVMPDYGSAMTSSIYMRGLGSRIDEPVLGILVDGIPLLDKNMFDFHLQDVRRIEVLRGPQGTLYGRNTMGGIMEIHTRMPLDITGQLINIKAGYSTANTFESAISLYRHKKEKFGWALSAHYDRTDGFYINQYNGHRVDYGQTAGGRCLFDIQPTHNWHITNSFTFDWIKQGAFPYASAGTGQINYNSPSSYQRFNIIASIRAQYNTNSYLWTIATSYQYLNDHMQMDNDYTPESIFTLRQQQHIHGATVDANVRSKKLCSWYDFQMGVSAFVKHGNMDAPVTFLHDGIEQLILSNANKGIRQVFAKDSLDIQENQFIVTDDFLRMNAGIALYHQSEFHPLPQLTLRLGVRLDAEHVFLTYDSHTTVHYRMTAFMSNFKPCQTTMEGTLKHTYFQCLPRFTIQYDWSKTTLYGYIAKGSKAGGYNTQIFSTIIQNRMMRDMMTDMGVHMDGLGDNRYTSADIITYRPEQAWTFEIGTHQQLFNNFRWDADVYYMIVKNMQVTVFPEGKTSGRMMTNAAGARSLGAETTFRYQWRKKAWNGILNASYGFTDARFTNFNDGRGDYSNKHIPYAPQHTMSLTYTTNYIIGNKALQELSLSVSTEGRGRIYWDEQNTLAQPFYALLNLSLQLRWRHVKLILWSRNITDTGYDVFYFVSMGNAFLQRAKPIQLGLNVEIHI